MGPHTRKGQSKSESVSPSASGAQIAFDNVVFFAFAHGSGYLQELLLGFGTRQVFSVFLLGFSGRANFANLSRVRSPPSLHCSTFTMPCGASNVTDMLATF